MRTAFVPDAPQPPALAPSPSPTPAAACTRKRCVTMTLVATPAGWLTRCIARRTRRVRVDAGVCGCTCARARACVCVCVCLGANSVGEPPLHLCPSRSACEWPRRRRCRWAPRTRPAALRSCRAEARAHTHSALPSASIERPNARRRSARSGAKRGTRTAAQTNAQTHAQTHTKAEARAGGSGGPGTRVRVGHHCGPRRDSAAGRRWLVGPTPSAAERAHADTTQTPAQ